MIDLYEYRGFSPDEYRKNRVPIIKIISEVFEFTLSHFIIIDRNLQFLQVISLLGIEMEIQNGLELFHLKDQIRPQNILSYRQEMLLVIIIEMAANHLLKKIKSMLLIC